MAWNTVGFGTGEPTIKPFLSEAKKIGSHSATTAVSNVAVAVAVNYFCPKWGLSAHTAAFVGLIAAVSYSLTNTAIEHFMGDENLSVNQEKALVVASVVGSTFLLLGRSASFPPFALAFLDIGLLEVGFCFNP